MEILKLNVVGHYYYNPKIEFKNYSEHNSKRDEKCSICLKSIYDPSYETISNNVNIMYDTTIDLGKCGHMFHSDCIKSWLKTNTICPIDKVMWCKHRTLDNNHKYCFNKKYFNNKKFKEKKDTIKQLEVLGVVEDLEIEEVNSDIEDEN